MMEGFPWFPFYVERFVNSRRVRLMDHANVGRYVLLLCEQWDHGPLPHSVDAIGRLLGLDSNAMANAWQQLGPCFDETDDGWVNAELEEVRAKQIAKREKRSMAGKMGAASRWDGAA